MVIFSNLVTLVYDRTFGFCRSIFSKVLQNSSEFRVLQKICFYIYKTLPLFGKLESVPESFPLYFNFVKKRKVFPENFGKLNTVLLDLSRDFTITFIITFIFAPLVHSQQLGMPCKTGKIDCNKSISGATVGKLGQKWYHFFSLQKFAMVSMDYV